MSSRKSSKRTASQAVPAAEIVVIEETIIPVAADPNQLVKPAVVEAAAAPKEVTASTATIEEESTLHKAKKMATEALHTASVKTSEVLHAAQAKFNEATAPTPTAAQAPFNIKEGELKPTETPTASTLDKAKATLTHVSEVIQSTAEHAYADLAAKSKSSGLTDAAKNASTTVAASLHSAAAQVSAALHGNTGSEVAREDVAMTDAKLGTSDASHSVEKKDGSLPIERCTDEFPHAKYKHETAVHSKLTPAGQTTEVIDKKADDLPLGSAKTTDAITSTTIEKGKMVDTQPDLFTGPVLSTHIGV